MTRAARLTAACLVLVAVSCTPPFTERGRVIPGTGFGVSVSAGGMIQPEVDSSGGPVEWNSGVTAGVSVQVEHGFSRRFAAQVGLGTLVTRSDGSTTFLNRPAVGLKVGLGERSSLALSCAFAASMSGPDWEWKWTRTVAWPDLTFAWDAANDNTWFIFGGYSGLGGGAVLRRELARRLDGHIRLQAAVMPPSLNIGVGLDGPTRR